MPCIRVKVHAYRDETLNQNEMENSLLYLTWEYEAN